MHCCVYIYIHTYICIYIYIFIYIYIYVYIIHIYINIYIIMYTFIMHCYKYIYVYISYTYFCQEVFVVRIKSYPYRNTFRNMSIFEDNTLLWFKRIVFDKRNPLVCALFKSINCYKMSGIHTEESYLNFVQVN